MLELNDAKNTDVVRAYNNFNEPVNSSSIVSSNISDFMNSDSFLDKYKKIFSV